MITKVSGGIQAYSVRGFTFISPVVYLLIGLVLAFLGTRLYHFSITIAEDYALIVRSGFDLYRFDLLKQLSCPIPKSYSSEFHIWRKLSDFMIVGPSLLDDNDLGNYALRNELLNTVEEPSSWIS